MKKINLVSIFIGYMMLYWVNTISAQGALPLLPLSNSPVSSNRSINTSNPVGIIKNQFDVSSTGGATYAIPIEIPVGTNGVQPKIGINYNSQSGFGDLGQGFSLSGLSAITRVSNNFFNDGNKKEMRLDTSDKFALDGQRLVSLAGKYGTNGCVYGTEVENYSRVTSYNTGVNGPDYFEVITEDKKVIRYGGGNATVYPQGSAVAYMWRISKITDVHGNYIEFDYAVLGVANNASETVISDIRYTGNDAIGIKPYNVIHFSYKRIEGVNQYLKGYLISKNHILDQISCYTNSINTRTYDFKYFKNFYFSNATQTKHYMICLNEVVESSKGKSLNSTVFNWGQEDFVGTQINTLNVDNKYEHSKIFTGDFNGDGKTDYIAFGYETSDLNLDEYLGMRLYLAKQDNTFDLVYTESKSYSGCDFYSANVADMDQDGDDDLQVLMQCPNNERVKVLSYDKVEKKLLHNYKFQRIYSLTDIDELKFVNGDFDGDGENDVVSFDDITFRSMINSYNTSDSFVKVFKDNFCNDDVINVNNSKKFSCSTIPLNLNHLSATDFNGNGISEFFMVSKNTRYTTGNLNYAIEVVDGKANKLIHNNLPRSIKAEDEDIYPADYNGDGKTDILTYDKDAKKWHKYISTGIGFIHSELPSSELPIYATTSGTILYKHDANNPFYEFTDCASVAPITVGDFNGDGNADILRRLIVRKVVGTTHYEYVVEFHVYYNNGNNFSKDPQSFWAYTIEGPDYCKKLGGLYTGDFDGDSKTDLLFPYYNAKWVSIHNIKATEKSNLLTSITNGYNNTINIKYQTLSHRETIPNVYTKSDDLIMLPNTMQIQGPLYVVQSVENPNGIGGVSTVSYTYKDMIVHYRGRGMLGFLEVNMTGFDGTKTRREMTLEKVFYTSRKNIVESYHLNYSNNAISRSIEFMGIVNLGNRYISRKTSSLNFDYIKNIKTEVGYEYIPYTSTVEEERGMMNKEEVKTIDLNNNSIVHATLSSLTFKKVGNFSRVKLDKHAEINLFGNEPIYSRTKSYEYDNITGDVLSIIHDENLPDKKMESNMQYDICGTVKEKQTRAGSSSIVKREEIMYDPYYRFVEKEINHLVSSNPIVHKYDYTTGARISTIDLMGHETSFEYDEWNREIVSTSVLGLKTKTYYEWSIGLPMGNILYKIRKEQDNAPDAITYYDQLGRAVFSELEGFNGRVFKTSTYNHLGQLVKVSLPYYSNEIPTYSYSEYDVLGRVTKEYDDCSNYRIYEYADRRISKNDQAGRITTETKDAAGNTIETTDMGGVVQYEYNSMLKPTKIITNGQVSSMEYDEIGNKIKMIDMSSGATVYEYDSWNNLVKQIDQKGNIIEFTYDELSRVTEQKIFHKATQTTDVYTTQYNTTFGQPGFGNISYTIDNKGSMTSFTYDIFNRIMEEEKVIKSKVFKTKNVYDSNNGNLNFIYYPSGFIAEHTYNNNGELMRISDQNGQILYELKEEDARGRERWANLAVKNSGISWGGMSGNRSSLVRLSNYSTCNDQVGLSMGLDVQSPFQASSHILFNFSYEYNLQTGNLSKRSDVIKKKYETFDYDNLDRLTRVTNDKGITSMYMNYGMEGNISSKSTIGNYSYQWPSYAVNTIFSMDCETEGPICYDEQNIIYNGFNKPISLMQGVYQMNVNYGSDMERNYFELFEFPSYIESGNLGVQHNSHNSNNIVELNPSTYPSLYGGYGTGVLIKEKYYAGMVERVVDLKKHTAFEYSYVEGPHGLFGVDVFDVNQSTRKFYYFQFDHQGSIMGLVDEDGNIVNEYSYDAWGKRRNPYTWSDGSILTKPSNVMPYTNWWNEDPIVDRDPIPWEESIEQPQCEPDYGFLIDRGYIGQEHLDKFDLINLNARLYDPNLGRMLSPDNFVTDAGSTQGYNRYSYALNNPLKYVDPDGNNPFVIAAIGAAISAAAYTVKEGFNSNWTFNTWNWGKFSLSIGIGAVSGLGASAISNTFASSAGMSFGNALANEMGRAFAHSMYQGVLSSATGGDFFRSFATSSLSSLAGSAFQGIVGEAANRVIGTVAFGAISGGVMEAVSGGNFWQGFSNGAIISLLNHELKQVEIIFKLTPSQRAARDFWREARKYQRVINKVQNSNDKDYLVFDAQKVDNKFRIDGKLTWYNRKGEVIASWSALSGSRGLYPISSGDWTLSNYRTRNVPSFTKDGIGFSVDINPSPSWGRTDLRIHPDGSPVGTSGCIGLTCGAEGLSQFSTMINNYLSINHTMKLIVTGNSIFMGPVNVKSK